MRRILLFFSRTVEGTDNFTIYDFAQYINGCEVYGSTLRVYTYSETGETIGYSGYYVSDEVAQTIDAKDLLSVESLREVVDEYEGFVLEENPIIYAINEYQDAPVVVYKIEASAVALFISAKTGELVAEEEHYNTLTVGEIKSLVKCEKMDQAATQSEIVLEKELELQSGKTVTIKVGGYEAVANSSQVQNIYTNLSKSALWYDEHFGRWSIDDNGMDLIGYAHYGNVVGLYDQASWMPDFGYMAFYDDDPQNLERDYDFDASKAFDSTVHEYTHGVFWKVVYKADTVDRAIHEGYSDVMAYFADGYDGGMGEDWCGHGYLSPYREYSTDPGPLDVETWKNDKENKSRLMSVSANRGDYSHSYCLYLSHAAYEMEKLDWMTHDLLEQLWYDSMFCIITGDKLYKNSWLAMKQACIINNLSREQFADIEQIYIDLNLTTPKPKEEDYVGSQVDFDALTSQALAEKQSADAQSSEPAERTDAIIGRYANLLIDISGVPGLYVDKAGWVQVDEETAEYLEKYRLTSYLGFPAPFAEYYDDMEKASSLYRASTDMVYTKTWEIVEQMYEDDKDSDTCWCYKETINGVDFIFMLDYFEGMAYQNSQNSYHGVIYYKDSKIKDTSTRAYEITFTGENAPVLPDDMRRVVGIVNLY